MVRRRSRDGAVPSRKHQANVRGMSDDLRAAATVARGATGEIEAAKRRRSTPSARLTQKVSSSVKA